MNHWLTRYRNSYLSYFLMYNFFFLAWALSGSLISVYLLDLGFRPSQVSLIVSVSFFASMLSQPVIGYLNDRFNTKRMTLFLFALTLLGAIAMIVAKSFLGILLAYGWTALLFNGVNPVMEKLATSGPFAYGKIRIWGTIGYSIGAQVAGYIYDLISPQAMFGALMVSMLIGMVGVWGIGGEREVSQQQPGSDKQSNKPHIRDLLTNKTYLIYTVLAVVVASIMNVGHTYIPAMLERSGMSVGGAATVVSIAVLCEGPLTYFSYLFMDKWKSKTLLLVSMGLVLVQCLVYSLDMSLTMKVIVTLLTKHTAGILYIMVNTKIVHSLVAPTMLITALSLVQTGRSLGSIVFQNISGFILDKWDYPQLFLVLLLATAATALMTLFISLPAGTGTALYSKK